MQLYERVVITGGGGMLAQDLDRVLRARGVSAVLARHSECDIADSSQVARYFKAHRPTLLLNCAADTAVDLCEERPERANAINGQGVGNLAEACREYGSRMVHYSTDFVFNGQNDRPYRPDDIPNPLSVYGKSKLLGEENLRQIGPPGWITVRTAWLFGRHGNCFPRVVLERARAGHVLKVVDDQIGCPTYSVDLAVATFALLDRGVKGIWHVTNSFPTSWFEFAKAILTEFAVSAEVTPISTSQWVAMRPKQAKRPKFSVLDLDAYAALTGEKLRDWRAALHDYRTECEKG